MTESNGTRGVSRRQFLGTGVGAAAAIGAGPAAVVLSGQDAGAEQTLVLTNGRIHTMDSASTVANSVTIRNGRFVVVNAAPAAGPGVRIIDLRGRMVVP